MIVEVCLTGVEGTELILRAPFTIAPAVGDQLHIPAEQGTIVVSVHNRKWTFEKNEDGGGITTKLVLGCHFLGAIPKDADPIPPTEEQLAAETGNS